MVFLVVRVDVETIGIELVLSPVSHIDILVGKGVDASSASTVLILSDVLSTVGIGDLLVLWFEVAGGVEELG